MKVGRPKLYKVVSWTKKEWGLFRWDTKEKTYHLVDMFKNESLATEEMERRYESRKLNKTFARRVKDFNVRNKILKRAEKS
jgi:hypothetical protein